MKTWQAKAPSNIALIKYMGKADPSVNRPTNASLSYTLDHLVTTVELEVNTEADDHWQNFSKSSLVLSEQGQHRFLNHLKFLKNEFQFSGFFTVRSKNNFPSDCGLASSASSFAALTLCAEKAIRKLKQGDLPHFTTEQISALSQKGSGSSCRSLFSPWALWKDQGAQPVTFPYQNLKHIVVVASSEKKQISSSEAHRLVTTSDLFNGRIERAQARLKTLTQSLTQKKWTKAYQTCWEEFWDMHALFETSKPHFGYMNATTLKTLNQARKYWHQHQDGPLITMDAGPNIHFLFREDQNQCFMDFKNLFTDNKVIASE